MNRGIYNGSLPRERSSSEETVLTLQPEFGAFNAIMDHTLSALGKNDQTLNIVLACEEIFTNIVNYSGANEISYTGKRSGNSWTATFTDNGVAFDPMSEEREMPEFSELDQGGMGIMFARMISREMIYERTGGRNVLTMIFDADDPQTQQNHN